MYDSVSLTEIPGDAEAVAGYVNGNWPTFPKLASKWPNAKRLSIAVSAEADADCLDIEKGDATPAQAPNWVRRQKARGVQRPVVYCSVSQARALLGTLAASGIPRPSVRVWTAHYTDKPHRCSAGCGFGMPTTADATQYTMRALGRNLDASLVSDTFFGQPSKLTLRAWILLQRARGVTWAALKTMWQWRLWRALGGK